MKILAIFHSKIFCKNQSNISDKECSQKKVGLVPIITTSLFWWSNVLVRWSKYQINFHRGVLQKLHNFRWLAVSLWEKLDTRAQSVFDGADSWTGKIFRHLAAKRRTYTVKSPIVRAFSAVLNLQIPQVFHKSCLIFCHFPEHKSWDSDACTDACY